MKNLLLLKSERLGEGLTIILILLGLLLHKMFLWLVPFLFFFEMVKGGFNVASIKLWPTLLFLFPCYIVLPGLFIDILDGRFVEGIKEVETRVTILIIYIAVVFLPALRDKKRIIYLFLIISFLFILYSLCAAIYLGFQYRGVVVHQWDFANTLEFYSLFDNADFNWSFLLYKNLSSNVGYDPLYFSLVVFFNILGCFRLLDEKVNRSSWGLLIGTYLAILVVFLFLLSAKTPFLLLGVTFLVFLKLRFQTVFSFRSAKLFLPLFLVFILTCSLLPESLFRLRNELHDGIVSLKEEGDLNQFKDSRISIWKLSFDIASKRPLVGFGIAGGKRFSEKYFEEENIRYFNSHSEWLNILITSGITGFIVCIYSLGTLSHYVLKGRDLYFLIVFVSFLIVFSIENLFTRFHGCAWYSLLLMLFAPGELFHRTEVKA